MSANSAPAQSFPNSSDGRRSTAPYSVGRCGISSARGPKGLRGSHSARGGVAGFSAALAERVSDSLALATPVEGVETGSDGFRVLADGSECVAARVLVCVPAAEARELIAPLDEEAARRIAGVEYAPIVSVALGVDPEDVAEPIRGFGYLIPREAELSLLGTLFPSRVFADRAPAGRELLHAMIGGKRWPDAVDADDGVVLGRVEEGLAKTLGARNIGGVLALVRWPRAVPQPGRRHIPEIVELRKGLTATCPGLSLAGSYLDGVSVADTLMSGVNAVRSG